MASGTLTNLAHLSELLQAHAQERGATPESLLAHLRACVEDPNRWDGEEAAELRLESDAAAVKLLTVHRSKGLEFPFVFLPMLWDPPSLRVDRPFLVRGETPEIDAGSEDFDARKEADQQEQFEESLRLLYVGLTRAKHRVVAHWIPVSGTAKSPLGTLMRDAVGVGEAALKTGAEWDDLLERWAAKADAAACADAGVEPGGCVGWEPADTARSRVAEREEEPLPELTLRDLDGSPPPALRSASFSSIAAGGHGGAETPEPQDRDGPAIDEPETAASPAGPLDEMPGGTGVGLLVHAVLEEALEAPGLFVSPGSPGGDVGSSAWCRTRVAEAAPTHGLDPIWAEPLGDALAATLSRPVLPGSGDAPAASLLGVPPADRSVELPFVLAAGGVGAVSADAVAAVLKQSGHAATAETGRRLRRSGFVPFSGFLEGFIDLAARHAGRWHVVDHKSNKLGSSSGGGSHPPHWKKPWSTRCTCCRATSTSPPCTACSGGAAGPPRTGSSAA